MAELKTKETAASVDDFLDAIPDETKRADARTLVTMMKKATGEKPKMWGPSIVGFGTHHYKYESGREGDICLLGFSPRKAALSLYLCSTEGAESLLEKLGKHKMGKGCLYIKKLADVDKAVLQKLLDRAAKVRSTGKK